MRGGHALALCLVVTGTWWSSSAVAAAAASCEGEQATIVGSGERRPIAGTEGRDVILTRGAPSVSAGGGDDLVCVSGRGGVVSVDAGDGNDRVVVRVDTTATVSLGAGNDTYVGGPGSDVVDRGTSPGADQISTGAGADSVHTGEAGVGNRDVVDLGEGRDEVVFLGIDNAAAVVEGGVGLDSVSASYGSGPAPDRDVLFDNETGRAVLGAEVVAQWGGMERFDVATFTTAGVTFVGSDAPEQVWATGGNPLSADLAGGDDRLRIDDVSVVESIDGGDGVDRLAAWSGEAPLAGSLDAQRIAFADDLDSAPDAPTVDFSGFESLELVGPQVRVTGSSGADLLRVGGCDVAAAAGSGPDRVVRLPATHLDGRCGRRTTTRLLGGPGSDSLVGGATDDVLLGGPGRDTATGRQGTDRCRAESTATCEAG